jgi:hypothetical protein
VPSESCIFDPGASIVNVVKPRFDEINQSINQFTSVHGGRLSTRSTPNEECGEGMGKPPIVVTARALVGDCLRLLDGFSTRSEPNSSSVSTRALQALLELEYVMTKRSRREEGQEKFVLADKAAQDAVVEVLQRALEVLEPQSRLVLALESALRQCEGQIRPKSLKVLRTSARKWLIEGARALKRGDGSRIELSAELPMDVLVEIMLKCDARTRAMAACASKAFKQAGLHAVSEDDDGAHFSRVTCSRCRAYAWSDESGAVCDFDCLRGKRHQWMSSHAKWKRDLRRALRMIGDCRRVGEDSSDELTSSSSSSSSDGEESLSSSMKFWNIR